MRVLLMLPIFLGMWLCSGVSAEVKVFNIIDFGAVPDGKTLNTKAIQTTIDKALAAKGTVVVPKGTFLTGALTLGPSITLELEEGATLLASPEMKDYPNEVFITAPFADSLTLRGKGTINGNGTVFFDDNWKFTERPEPWIVISDAKGVTVKGIRFENSPSHTLNFNFCDGVVVDSIRIKNDPRSPNTDGIDIRNTKNITITNSDIRTGDDAICLKVTSKEKLWTDPNGNPRPRVVENVNVKNCYLESDDSALKLGTGSGNLTQNILFEDITIRNTRYAVGFFMMDGGTYQNVLFKNLDVETGSRHAQEYAVFMDIHQRKMDSKVGRIESIKFESCAFKTKGIFYLSGHPQQNINDILFEKVSIVFEDNLDNSKWKKPKGNKKIKQWESTSDFTQQDAKIILAHGENIRFKDVSIQKATPNYPILWEHNAIVDTTNVQIQ
ncbi:MAG: glycosyl hydrolase family 28 protein [Bacteroidota bacterium]